MPKKAASRPCTSPDDDLARFRFLARFARENSHDPDTQNAAGVASGVAEFLEGNPFGWGYDANRLPSDDIEELPERLTRPAKYDWIMHAEAAAVVAAGSRAGCGTLYALWAACPDCAKVIVRAFVSEVVTLQRTQDMTPNRWKDKVKTGLEILEAGGVAVRFFQEEIGETVRFDGKEVKL